MNNTIKALLTLSIPLLVLAMIFKITVLQAYISAKKLEQVKMAQVASENVKRSPAVVSFYKR